MSPRSSIFGSTPCALVLAAGLAVGFASVGTAVCAETEVITDSPPPPPRAEHPPPPRDGYVWGAGHWEWNRHSYVWVSGTWIVERRAAHWVSDGWEQVGTQWHFVPGH